MKIARIAGTLAAFAFSSALADADPLAIKVRDAAVGSEQCIHHGIDPAKANRLTGGHFSPRIGAVSSYEIRKPATHVGSTTLTGKALQLAGKRATARPGGYRARACHWGATLQ